MRQAPNHLKILPLLFIVLTIHFFTSCIKDEINTDKISNSVNWDLNYDAPLAYGSLTLSDIVKAIDSSGYVKEDNTGLLHLIYRNNVFSQSAGTLLPIPTQDFKQDFFITDPDFPAWLGKDSVNFTRKVYFDFSSSRPDVEIDSIKLKMGFMSFKLTINFPYPCKIVITFPTLKKNGRALTQTIVKNNSDPTYNSNLLPISLTDYKLSLEKVGGAPNKIPVIYDIVVRNSKGVVISANTISSDIGITMAAFSSIFGYLGEINDLMDATNQKITLNFFDNSMSNLNVEFEQPKITAYVRNSFGVPVRVQVSNAKTYSEKTNTYFPITFNSNPIWSFNLKYPTANQVGATVNDTIPIQSNLFDAIKTSPHYFYYDATAMTNPGGKTGSPNFFTDSSKVDIDVELDLPLKFKAANVELIDTMEMDIGSTFKDFSIIKRIVLFNTYTNSLPFDLKVQVFLADEKKIVIDSLYNYKTQPIIRSGVFNTTTGRYTFSNPNTISIPFDEERSKRLEKVKFALVKIGITTAENGQKIVSFYSDYLLNVAFKAQAELKVRSLNQF